MSRTCRNPKGEDEKILKGGLVNSVASFFNLQATEGFTASFMA